MIATFLVVDVKGKKFACMQLVVDALRPILANDTTIDSKLAITSGRISHYFVGHIHDVVRICCKEIEKARSEILITSSYWEGASLSAFMLSRSLRRTVRNNGNIVIKIVVDNGSRENIGKKGNLVTIDKHKWKKELGLFFDDMLQDVQVKSVHVPLLGTMHAKFLVVDNKRVVISSNNVQDRPNAEMAVTMEGRVVSSFRDIFMRLFHYGGKVPKNLPLFSESNEQHETEEDVQILMVSRGMYGGLFHDVVCPQNCAWWTLMSIAKKSITICSPTFNAEHAIDGVIEACKRKVSVRLILTKNFNDKKEALPFQGGTNTVVVQKMKRRLRKAKAEEYLVVEWYIGAKETEPRKGVHSHVKFMIVDGEMVMFGNGNMDTQSWYHSMEVNVLLKDTNLAKYLNNVATMNFSMS